MLARHRRFIRLPQFARLFTIAVTLLRDRRRRCHPQTFGFPRRISRRRRTFGRQRPVAARLYTATVRPATFALFLDVMGVQQQLSAAGSEEGNARGLAACRDSFDRFHRDVHEAVGREIDRLASGGNVGMPSFVAEFSDSAYIVADDVSTLLATAVIMMRRSLEHKYPLRGGLGFGSFMHETSGSSTRGDGQVWSSSSFFGGAIVTAYQAERCKARGLRVFVHPAVCHHVSSYPKWRDAILAMPYSEATDSATHEVRIWSSQEAPYATARLIRFRDRQQLTRRAKTHYVATGAAYSRFASERSDLPFDPPNLWVWGEGPISRSG